ncbi:MAG: hypothetical protein NXH70_04125 [Hyphomonas sp.]|nr:hypothetical protein [Hyphomonas sp.]
MRRTQIQSIGIQENKTTVLRLLFQIERLKQSERFDDTLWGSAQLSVKVHASSAVSFKRGKP